MFCFPISDHVMVTQRTVFFFKYRPMHVDARSYVYEKKKRKISWRTSRGLNLEGKT